MRTQRKNQERAILSEINLSQWLSDFRVENLFYLWKFVPRWVKRLKHKLKLNLTPKEFYTIITFYELFKFPNSIKKSAIKFSNATVVILRHSVSHSSYLFCSFFQTVISSVTYSKKISRAVKFDVKFLKSGFL